MNSRVPITHFNNGQFMANLVSFMPLLPLPLHMILKQIQDIKSFHL